MGCFGFDRIDLRIKERVEELPGLVKRQKKTNADNTVQGPWGQQAVAA